MNKRRRPFIDLFLGVNCDVYFRVCSFVDREHFIAAHVIIGELFAVVVNTACLFCKHLAEDHFIH